MAMAGPNDQKVATDDDAVAPTPSKTFKLLDNKVILLGMIVALQVIMALAITQLVIVPRLSIQAAQLAGQAMPEPSDAQESSQGVIVGLEEIIVTLQGNGDAPHYLRINVNLEVDSQKTAALVTERLPQLRDAVILVLSSKKAAELITPEGNLAIRAEIMRKLAEKLPANSLRNIYFSDLVIQ
jgi:flagellar FliL protein